MTNIKSSVNGVQLVHLNTNYIQPGLRKANTLGSVLIHFQDGIHTYLAELFFFTVWSGVLLKVKASLQIDTQKNNHLKINLLLFSILIILICSSDQVKTHYEIYFRSYTFCMLSVVGYILAKKVKKCFLK